MSIVKVRTNFDASYHYDNNKVKMMGMLLVKRSKVKKSGEKDF